jgi:3-oxoadipate enol-lactonase
VNEEDQNMTPLVLLHAFPYDSRMFADQVSGLGDIAKVLTPDLPGFGSEPVIPGLTLDQIADRTASLLDHHGISKAVVGGVSMGGYAAMAYARKYPQRLSGLILADTRAEPDDDTTKAGRAKAIELVRQQGVALFIETQIPKLISPASHADQPAFADRVRSLAIKQTPAGVMEALAMLRDRPDARPGLQSVICPTLIVVGDDDAITPPPLSEAMALLVPRSTLVRIPNAGHLANWERPAEFNAAVRSFLQRI